MSSLYESIKNFGQSELQRGDGGWSLRWESGSSSWCKPRNFFPNCSPDWPVSFKPSYMTDLFPCFSHVHIHLTKIQWLWRWRQQAALKCWNTPIMLHGVRIQNTIMWAWTWTWNLVSMRNVNEKFKIKIHWHSVRHKMGAGSKHRDRTQYVIMSDQQNADKITIYSKWI
jgi:hypothetical protein